MTTSLTSSVLLKAAESFPALSERYDVTWAEGSGMQNISPIKVIRKGEGSWTFVEHIQPGFHPPIKRQRWVNTQWIVAASVAGFDETERVTGKPPVAQASDTPASKQETEVLYLHCMDSLGDKRLFTLMVTVGSPFEVGLDESANGSLIAGRIKRTNDILEATLTGNGGSGFEFSGKVELERLYDTEMTWFAGAMYNYAFVFSRHREVEPFLKSQAVIGAQHREERRKASQNASKAGQAGADQPATKPADKVPANDQPSTPTPKDAPR